MTSKEQLKGIHQARFGSLLFTVGAVTIITFFMAALWVGNVRLLPGVVGGVLLMLVGLVLMRS